MELSFVIRCYDIGYYSGDDRNHLWTIWRCHKPSQLAIIELSEAVGPGPKQSSGIA